MKAFLRKLYYKVKFNLLSGRRKEIDVMSAVETVKYIQKNKCSVARFGDGELNMILRLLYGYDSSLESGFQNFDDSLGKRLKEVLTSVKDQDNCLVCLPGCMFGTGTGYLRDYAAEFWESYTVKKFDRVVALLDKTYLYGDTNFSRFYLSHRDKSHTREYLNLVSGIWSGRNILIVEGQKTRLGVGNDLFADAASIRRILCPPTDAWGAYERIFSVVRSEVRSMTEDAAEPLVICALGMTATVLAYDLSRMGFQAIDLGHIDIEYEWMLMGATEKVPIPGKYTNEAYAEVTDNISGMEDYRNEIIKSIC